MTMDIEYTATPGDLAALYSYTRRRAFKLAFISYGLPIALAAIVLFDSRSPSHSLTLTDWVDSLHVTDEHIFLIRKNMNGFAIPRQAFVDETQRRDSSA
jgi:hypothetical protein